MRILRACPNIVLSIFIFCIIMTVRYNFSTELFAQSDSSFALSGKEQYNYNLHCLGCHGMEGKGITDVPPFPGVLGYFLHTPEGREFIIQVPGVSHSDLSNLEIAQLTNWLLDKFSKAELPPGHKPFTEEEVASYRSSPIIDVDKRRREMIDLLKSRSVLPE